MVSRTRDEHGFLELKLDRPLDPQRQVSARAYVNTSDYTGHYVTDGVDVPDESQSRAVGAEAALNWDIASAHRLTVGGEVRHDLRAIYFSPVAPGSEVELPNTVVSAYIQEATDRATGRRLSTSPDHNLKAGAARDLTSWLALGADARYESGRWTLAGTRRGQSLLTTPRRAAPSIVRPPSPRTAAACRPS